MSSKYKKFKALGDISEQDRKKIYQYARKRSEEIVRGALDRQHGPEYYQELPVAQAALLLADIVFGSDTTDVGGGQRLVSDDPTLREVAQLAYEHGYRIKLALEPIK